MTNSSADRLADLTNAIIRRSKDGTLTWEKTSTEGEFSTSIGEYVVHIYTAQRFGVSDLDYHIDLFDKFGERVESYSDVSLAGKHAMGYDGFFPAMADLYDTARQQGAGIHKAIDEILRLLS